MAEEEWGVKEGTGWITIPDFGRINPRRDNENGGRQYFTAKTLDDEFCKAHGDCISKGPETFHFEFDQPFLLADGGTHTLEVQISLLPGGRYAIKYREGEWPDDEAGPW